MKILKSVLTVILFGLFTTVAVWGAWDKDKPAAGTSLRSSNPEILANNTALQTALDAEHDFGSSTQTGSHTPGSARAFFQDAAPTTQIDGGAFATTDLGSLWFDTDTTIDNTFYVLTATTPTWTLVSTNIIATMVAANQTFAGTVKSTGDFTVGANKVVVTAASGNTAIAGTLGVTGIATLGDGSLATTQSASNASTKIATTAYVDTQTDTDIPTHDGVIKGWAEVTGSNGALVSSYNVTSSSRSSQGVYVISWDTNFANANYCVVVSVRDASYKRIHRVSAQASGSVTITVEAWSDGGVIDPTELYVMAIGTQ